MEDFVLFMHDDASDRALAGNDALWGRYFTRLRHSGAFEGGSSIGAGVCLNKAAATPLPLSAINGYIRIRAESLVAAQAHVAGNPVYEAGGTVELRHLPREG